MNRWSTLTRLSSALALLILLSCQHQGLEPAPQPAHQLPVGGYHVANGIVHFDDHNAFFATVDQIRQLPLAQRAGYFGQSEAFRSYLSYYQEALTKLKAGHSPADWATGSVSPYVANEDGYPVINFVTPALAAVANKDGLVYVGRSLIRFVGDQEIIVKNGDIAQAMGPRVVENDNVIVFDTRNEVSAHPQARQAAKCRILAGQTGSFAVWGDGSRVETRARRVSAYTGDRDQYRVSYYVRTEGKFENTGWFDGSSNNNTLQSVYTCDIYDSENRLVASRSANQTSTGGGQSIAWEDSAIDAGLCFSFQVRYFYANFSPGTIKPLPEQPCSLQNCISSYPIYTNEKHRVVAGCTDSDSN